MFKPVEKNKTQNVKAYESTTELLHKYFEFVCLMNDSNAKYEENEAELLKHFVDEKIMSSKGKTDIDFKNYLTGKYEVKDGELVKISTEDTTTDEAEDESEEDGMTEDTGDEPVDGETTEDVNQNNQTN